MLEKAPWIKRLGIYSAMLAIILLTGCKNTPTDPGSTDQASNQAALEKLADQDSSMASFEPNYNEDQAMSFFGKTTTTVYPFKVGQKMRVVSKDFTSTIVGDTAYGTYTKNFEGVLFIAVSYESSSTKPDTVIQKPFTSQITRKVIFVKHANTDNPLRNWRIAAISLPQGGTLTSNISITKLTIITPNDTIEVNSPNDYFLARGRGWWKEIPKIERNKNITVRVELNSTYADTDFVSLTHGGDFHGMHRSKIKLDLVSSVQSGSGYSKVYEQTFVTHQWLGYFHAVINAYPKQVIFDDVTPVESSTWGIPYFVK